jgi:hypothetical protein
MERPRVAHDIAFAGSLPWRAAQQAEPAAGARMTDIDRNDLQAAQDAGLIRPEQLEPLWQFLCARRSAAADSPRFTFTHILYYLGGMLAIGAMSLFMTLGWESFGGWGMFFIALLYAGTAFKVANMLEAKRLHIPAGIMATFIVVLVPLAVYGLQHALGFWADGARTRGYRDYHYYIDWRWIVMELATLAAGAAMLRRYRYPFLLMPLSVTLWYMSMDIVPFLIGIEGSADNWFSGAAWDLRKWISIAFGLAMLLGALLVDLRSRFTRDYAFWLYLFGLLAFWGGLSAMHSDSLAGKLVYLAINVALILKGAMLARRVFVVFGGLGVTLVLGDISWRFFRDSWSFPIALTLIGFAIIALGIWWQKHEAALSSRLRAMLPQELRELIEARQG